MVLRCVGDDRYHRNLPRLSDSGVCQSAGLRDRRRRRVRSAVLLLLPFQQHHRVGQLGRQLRRLLRLPAPVSTAPEGVLRLRRAPGAQRRRSEGAVGAEYEDLTHQSESRFSQQSLEEPSSLHSYYCRPG